MVNNNYYCSLIHGSESSCKIEARTNEITLDLETNLVFVKELAQEKP